MPHVKRAPPKRPARQLKARTARKSAIKPEKAVAASDLRQAKPQSNKSQPNKFARYRASKQAKGMKLIRIWVPDVNAPGFAEEAERQAKLLQGRPEELEADEFAMRAFDWDAP